MTSNITVPDGWVISYEDPNLIKELLPYQYIDMGIGGGGIFINLVLLSILISSKYFLNNGRLTILLCIGDLINCLYICLQGYQRSLIYVKILNYNIIRPMTYWTCALMPFDWTGIIGSLLTHMVTLVMGLERIIALKFPVIFKRYFSNNQIVPTIFCLGYVVLSVIIAFILAFIKRNVLTKYYCGRKASYTAAYTSFIYIMNIVGYSVCFLLTIIVMLHIKLTSKESLEK
uniref:G_PROTEIN_RECEP_F1_2 domain-containing protein n=1 Tax=Strongyloides papillosus TaxID=174720 RepID=A0A0N5BE65_STREA